MKWYPVIQGDLGLLIQSCHAWNQKASSGGSRSNRFICLFVILVINLFYKGDISGSRGGGGGRRSRPSPLLKNHKNIGFLGNTGPDPLTNHKATKPAFNIGSSSARQRNAILMAFRWRANVGPLIVVFGSSLQHQRKKHSRACLTLLPIADPESLPLLNRKFHISQISHCEKLVPILHSA